MELPYIAGLFDGEGTVVIAGPTPSEPRKHQLRVAVCMTDEPTIRFLHSAVGFGSVKIVDASKYNPRASTRFDWTASGNSAAVFLVSIRPWLITKARAADIAFEFRKTVGIRGIPISEQLFSKRETLREQIKEANKRGC